MLSAPLLAIVVAVLSPGRLLLVETESGETLRQVALPGEGLALFAAPDGRVVVPMREEDATAVVDGTGRVERWPGRLFPLFFDEIDRMHVVLRESLDTFSYPERLLLRHLSLPGLTGARRAAVNRDGRLVVVIPAGSPANSLLLIAALEGGSARRVALMGEATVVALAPDGAFAVVAIAGGALEMVQFGPAVARRPLLVGSEVHCLTLDATGKWLFAGAGLGSAGALLGVRVNSSGKEPLAERFRTSLPAPVRSVALAGRDVVAVCGEQLAILDKGGRRVRRTLPAPGAQSLAVLAERPASTVPAWSGASDH